MLLKDLIKALHRSVGGARAPIDGAVRSIEESNRRIEAMEKFGRQPGSLKGKIEVAEDFDAPLPDSSNDSSMDRKI